MEKYLKIGKNSFKKLKVRSIKKLPAKGKGERLLVEFDTLNLVDKSKIQGLARSKKAIDQISFNIKGRVQTFNDIVLKKGSTGNNDLWILELDGDHWDWNKTVYF